jgi:hypothetical protein
MNTISLTKTHVTASGSVHVQIKINNNDVGLLYLTPQEIEVITSALRDGLINSDTLLDTDLFDEEYNEEEIY